MTQLERMEREVRRLCGLYLRAEPGSAKEEAHKVWAAKSREYEAAFAEAHKGQG